MKRPGAIIIAIGLLVGAGLFVRPASARADAVASEQVNDARWAQCTSMHYRSDDGRQFWACCSFGDLDKRTIGRYVKRHLPAIRHCYDRVLRKNPTAAGRVLIEWTIYSTGKVTEVIGLEDTFDDGDVAACVTRVLGAVRFPAWKARKGAVVVRYPFTFRAPARRSARPPMWDWTRD